MGNKQAVSIAVSLFILLSLCVTPLTSSPMGEGKDIVLVFDASSSMRQQLPSGQLKIDAARDAVKAFLASLKGTERVCLISFYDCSNIELTHSFTTNHVSIGDTVDRITAQGNTPLEKGLQYAWDVLEQSGDATSDWYIVLFSDGEETCSGYPCSAAEYILHRSTSFRETKIYTIAYLINPSSSAAAELQCIASTTGGEYYSSSTVEDFFDAFSAIATAIYDADNDGIPDDVDLCPDTPSNAVQYVDETGCIRCLGPTEACALHITALIPFFGLLPATETIINASCIMSQCAETNDALGSVVGAMMCLSTTMSAIRGLTGIVMPHDLILAVVGCLEGYARDWMFYHCGGYSGCLDMAVDGLRTKLMDTTKTLQSSVLTLFTHSPVSLGVYDENGFLLSEGDINSYGYIMQYGSESIGMIPTPEGEYVVTVVGTEKGTYTLDIGAYSKGYEKAFSSYSRGIEKNEIHEYRVRIDTEAGNVVRVSFFPYEGKQRSHQSLILIGGMGLLLFVVLVGVVMSRERGARR